MDRAIQQVARKDEGKWQPLISPKLSGSPLVSPPGVWSSPTPWLAERSPAGSGGSGELQLIINNADPDAAPLRKQLVNVGQGARMVTRGVRSDSKFEVEQLLASPGSLPPPLRPDEREAAMRAYPPTATSEMMAQVSRDLLVARGPEAQELRRKLLRGSTIVFVSAGYPGKRFIFERAAELGVKSVIIDHPDSWSRELVTQGIIAKFCPVDMSLSSEEVFKGYKEAIERLGEDGVTGAVDGIATFVEL